MKVTYVDNGKQIEKTFATEEEGKQLKAALKTKGIKNAKWEW